MHCELLYTLSNIENYEDFLINMFLREFSCSSQSAQGGGGIAYNDPLVYYTTGGYILCLEQLYLLGLVSKPCPQDMVKTYSSSLH